MGHDDIVWRPDDRWTQEAEITGFLRWLRDERGLDFDGYLDAWRWSVDDVGAFWEAYWAFEDVLGERGDGPALAVDRMPGAEWFPGSRVNYAEHLLRNATPGRPALIAVPEEGEPVSVGWDELAAQAGALARTLRSLGVGKGDRVVAYVNNLPHAVVGLIATTSIGAIWSVCAPDFGTAGVIARFRQLRPKVLLAVDGYVFNGKRYPRSAEVAELAGALDGLEHVIWIDNLEQGSEPPVTAISWAEATAEAADLEFERVAFADPLWMLFSSGTTGTPKAIVQGHGGIVLEHLKALRIGLDMKPEDRLLMLASTSWMVWNVLISALMRGSTVVLMDGNPVGEDLRRVWRVCEQVGVTVLGLGASLLHGTIKAGIVPREEFDLSALREVISTGSPLAPDAYSWVGRAIGERVWINSSSGGTDVCSTFVGGSPLLPVRAGRLQAPALAVAVEAWDDAGDAQVGQTGELVVTRPMPSMPLYFWNDPEGKRYHDSYFATYPGVWRHGDFIEFDADGSSVIQGRSDSTLNRNGIRMGSAEIYSVVEGLPEVTEALVVGVEQDEGQDYFMPLFVSVSEGVGEDEVRKRIVAEIRAQMSPRHVPDEIVVVPGVPHTKTGKKLEVPVKRLLQGAAPDEVADPASIDDPALLDVYVEFARRRQRAAGG